MKSLDKSKLQELADVREMGFEEVKNEQEELLKVVVMENKRNEQGVIKENREKILKLRREFAKAKEELEGARQTRADEIKREY